MERNLITGFSVDPAGPVLFATQDLVSLQTGQRLNWALSPQRYCTGYDEPGGGIGHCPDDAPAGTGGRCEKCLERTRILPCLRCTGATCGNPARRAKCVFADHYVYLACYSNELFKVGVTKVERLERRIIEQGAWAAIAVAAAGGQEVRRLETAVSRAGWPDRVNMLSLLGDASLPAAQAEELLRQEARRIVQRLPDEPFVHDGRMVYVVEAYPALEARPRLLDPNTDPLAGTVVGIRGGYLLLQVDEQLLTISLRALIGRELSQRTQDIAGPAQASLAF